MQRVLQAAYFRNFIFGVEDSLVSTVGLVSGIAFAGAARADILLTGVVLVFVEAFSMAAGAYVAERSGDEYVKKSSVSPVNARVAGAVMFVSYLMSGAIPLLPYIFFSGSFAIISSIGAALAALALLGFLGARITKTPALSRSIQMLLVGGAAILIGVGVGRIVGS